MKPDITQLRIHFPDHADELARVLALQGVSITRYLFPYPFSDAQMDEYMAACDSGKMSIPMVQALAKALGGDAVRLGSVDYVQTNWTDKTIAYYPQTRKWFVGPTLVATRG